MEPLMRLSLVVIATTCSLLSAMEGVAAERRRPNILFMIVDDQSPFDLKVYEPNSALQTPVIDRIAAEGMVFDAAHHMGSFMGAVCTPSRHARRPRSKCMQRMRLAGLVSDVSWLLGSISRALMRTR